MMLLRIWPNRRIHALKAKAFLSGSENGRGFGSLIRHQYNVPRRARKAGILNKHKGFGSFHWCISSQAIPLNPGVSGGNFGGNCCYPERSYPQMLTDAAIRKAKPKAKAYKLADGGGCFCLLPPPAANGGGSNIGGLSREKKICWPLALTRRLP